MSLEESIQENTAALKALTAAILNQDHEEMEDSPAATGAAEKPAKAGKSKANGKAAAPAAVVEEISFEQVAKELTALGQSQGREAAVKALTNVVPTAKRLGDIDPSQYADTLKSIRAAAEALV